MADDTTANRDDLLQEVRSLRQKVAELEGSAAAVTVDEAGTYRSILRASPAALVLFAEDGTIVEASRAAAELYGYGGEEFVGRSAREIIRPHLPDLFTATMERLDWLLPFATDSTDLRKDGATIRTRLQVSPVVYAGRRCLLVAVNDVSATHAARQALAASEAQYLDLFQDSPLALWEADFSEVRRYLDALVEEGITDLRRHLEEHPAAVTDCVAAVKVLDVNQTALELFEVEREGLLREGLMQLLGGQSLEIFWEALIALVEGRGGYNGEATFHSASGRALQAIVTLSVATGCEESWSRVVVSILDVTAQKAVEGALQESRREAQTLLSNLPGLVYRCCADDSRTVELISEGCQSLTGYSPADLVANRCVAYNDLIHPDDRGPVSEAVRSAVARREPYRLQYRIATRDGDEKWVWEQGRGVYSAAGDLVALEGYVTDITPVRQAEEVAARSGHILDDSLNEVYLFDPETLRFVQTNRGARENLGYSPAELQALTPLDLLPEYTSDSFAALLTPLRTRERQNLRLTTTHRRKDGSCYPVDVHLQLCCFGAAPVFISIVTDITERQRAEEELHRLNRAMKAMNECNRLLVHATEETEFLDGVCRLMVEVGGYRLVWVAYAEDDPQRTVRPVAHAGHEAGYLDQVAITWSDSERGYGPTGMAIRTGRPTVAQDIRQEPTYEPWREDAARRGYAAAIALPLGGSEGRPFGALNLYAGEANAFDANEVELLVGLAEDVSYAVHTLRAGQARRQAEERLRKLSAAVEQSPVSVIITDVKGRIEYVNRAFTEVTGSRSEEVVGRVSRLLEGGNMSAEGHRRLWDAITSGHTWHGEFHNVKQHGQPFWERASISPIRGDDGEITHFVAATEDITAHKAMAEETQALEAQLRRAQKMEAIGTLAGGIAHDFNNLLQAIIGYGGMALQDTPKASRVSGYLEHILKAAGLATELVRQILTFSRQVEVARRPIQIGGVVDEAINLLRATLPTTIELHQSIDPHSYLVLADASQIQQVVMNLCTNAYQAMDEEGGVLEVSLANVEITSDPAAAPPQLSPGSYVRLRVRDTGGGIDPANLERIFDPFFSTKGKEGTGLGLSVVHGIVVAQGGRIDVRSELGRGTTFDVYFPPVTEEEVMADAVVEGEVTGKEHILYVEDDADVAEMVREMLRRLGYQVTLSTNGADALDLIRAAPERFDVVVTDQVMPRLTGTALAEQLHAFLPDLPIMLITGFGDRLPSQGLDQLGIRELLRKPVLATQLSRAIRRVMGKQDPLSR